MDQEETAQYMAEDEQDAKVCKAKQRNEKQNIKRTQEKERDDDDETSSDEEYFSISKIKHIKRVKTNNILIPIRIEDVEVQIEPDSGADGNIMDDHQFKALKNRSSELLHLKPSKTKLSTLKSDLPVKGEVHVMIRNKTRGIERKIIIVEGRSGSPPLLGRDTLTELGMLKIA